MIGGSSASNSCTRSSAILLDLQQSSDQCGVRAYSIDRSRNLEATQDRQSASLGCGCRAAGPRCVYSPPEGPRMLMIVIDVLPPYENCNDTFTVGTI